MLRLFRRNGMTLVEVTIAVVILVIVLGPFLKNLIWHAKTGEDTEKMAMAIKILQSVKEEVQAVRFKDFTTYADKITPDASDSFHLDDMFFPESRNQVIKFQDKYRDFELTGSFKFVHRVNRDVKERSMLSALIEVTWDQPKVGKQRKTLSITVVDPKS
jgi:prepilin-type N-terminal cleavage/methylation domain-containing protein